MYTSNTLIKKLKYNTVSGQCREGNEGSSRYRNKGGERYSLTLRTVYCSLGPRPGPREQGWEMTMRNNAEGVTWPMQVMGLSERSFPEQTVPEVSAVAGPIQGPSLQELLKQQERQTEKHNQSMSHTAESYNKGECNKQCTPRCGLEPQTSRCRGLGKLSHLSVSQEDAG